MGGELLSTDALKPCKSFEVKVSGEGRHCKIGYMQFIGCSYGILHQ